MVGLTCNYLLEFLFLRIQASEKPYANEGLIIAKLDLSTSYDCNGILVAILLWLPCRVAWILYSENTRNVRVSAMNHACMLYFIFYKLKKAINNIRWMRWLVKYQQWSLKFCLIKKLLINNFSLNWSRPTRTKLTVVSKYYLNIRTTI